MKKKALLLLISCLLMTTGLYAQSERVRVYELENEIQEDTVQVVLPDTTAQLKEIPVTLRTWDNLEQTLKDEVIRLSKGYANKKVSKSEVVWIYEIRDVPTSIGNSKTFYLNVLTNGKFILSNENPNQLEDVYVYECYFNLTPSCYQTDNERFGTPVSTGDSLKLVNVKSLW